MHGEEVLLTICEFAVAIGGFTSIVAVFGNRSSGWQPVDRLRVQATLQQSLGAGFFALLPSAMFLIGVSEPLSWRILSVAYAGYIGLGMVMSTRQLRQLDETDRELLGTIGPTAIPIVAATAALLLLGNTFRPEPDSGLYVTALMLSLALAAVAFVRTIFIRPG